MVTPVVSGLPPIPAATGADYAGAVPARQASGTDRDAARQAEPAPDGGSAPVASTTLEKAVTLANSSLQAWSTGMRFDIDAASGRVVVSITDSKTGEVLRTIPTDAVLRTAKMIMQMQEKTIHARA